MANVSLFAEDAGHEAMLKPLILRMGREHAVRLSVRSVSVRGGYGKAMTELKRYAREIETGSTGHPDLLVVATDSNCKGYNARKREIEEATAGCSAPVVCAVPDPHIERWFLLDSAAFKEAVGKGCSAPDHKCDRDRYKKLLLEAVRQAGLASTFGGIEHAEAIVDAMRVSTVERADASFRHFVRALRHELANLKSGR